MSDACEVVVSIAATVWPLIMEQMDNHSRSFQRALKSFVEFLFHPSIVLRCRVDENFCVVTQQEVMPINARRLFRLQL